MKEIKRVELKRLVIVTGFMGIIVGFLYSILLLISSGFVLGLEISPVLEVIYLTIAFGIGSAIIWLIYGAVYNYIVVPLTGGIKINF